MDLNKLRKEYETHGIDEGEMAETPFRQFQLWFELAIRSSPGLWAEANAMTVATSGKDGVPTARTVLLKGYSDDGFEFFTNYESIKGKALAENPRVSLLFHWAWMDRQVRIDGTVTRTSRERTRDYFYSRPRGAQIGAVASIQSTIIPSRQWLDDERRKLEEKYGDDVIPVPDNWGGYLVNPESVEFWQGRLDRLHDRLVYQRSEKKGWELVRLSP